MSQTKCQMNSKFECFIDKSRRFLLKPIQIIDTPVTEDLRAFTPDLPVFLQNIVSFNLKYV